MLVLLYYRIRNLEKLRNLTLEGIGSISLDWDYSGSFFIKPHSSEYFVVIRGASFPDLLNMICVGRVTDVGSEFLFINCHFWRQCSDEDRYWQFAKNSSANLYVCSHCNSNCLDSKDVFVNFGSNDLLKVWLVYHKKFPIFRRIDVFRNLKIPDF